MYMNGIYRNILYKNLSLMIFNVQCTQNKTNAVTSTFYKGTL